MNTKMVKNISFVVGTGMLFLVLMPMSTAYLQANVFSGTQPMHDSRRGPQGDSGMGNFEDMQRSGASVKQLKTKLKQAEKQIAKAKKSFDKMKKKVEKYSQAVKVLDACTSTSTDLKKQISACKKALKKVFSAMRSFPMAEDMTPESVREEMQTMLSDLSDSESSADIDQMLEDFHDLTDDEFSSESFEEEFQERMEEMNMYIEELQEAILEAEEAELERKEEMENERSMRDERSFEDDFGVKDENMSEPK